MNFFFFFLKDGLWCFPDQQTSWRTMAAPHLQAQWCSSHDKTPLAQRLLWYRWMQPLVFCVAFTHGNMNMSVWEDHLVKRQHSPETERPRWLLLPKMLCFPAHVYSFLPAGLSNVMVALTSLASPASPTDPLWGTGFPLVVCWFSLQCLAARRLNRTQKMKHGFLQASYLLLALSTSVPVLRKLNCTLVAESYL